MKKKKVKFIYTFEIEYEHIEHLNDILKSLNDEPIISMSGAGAASNNKVYGYRCKRINGGKQVFPST